MIKIRSAQNKEKKESININKETKKRKLSSFINKNTSYFSECFLFKKIKTLF